MIFDASYVLGVLDIVCSIYFCPHLHFVDIYIIE